MFPGIRPRDDNDQPVRNVRPRVVPGDEAAEYVGVVLDTPRLAPSEEESSAARKFKEEVDTQWDMQSRPCQGYYNFESKTFQPAIPAGDRDREGGAFFRVRGDQGQTLCMDLRKMLADSKFRKQLEDQAPGSYITAKVMEKKLDLETDKRNTIAKVLEETASEEKQALADLEEECRKRREGITQRAATVRADAVRDSNNLLKRRLEHFRQYAEKFPDKPLYEDSYFAQILGEDDEDVAKRPVSTIIRPLPGMLPGERRMYAVEYLEKYTNLDSNGRSLKEDLEGGETTLRDSTGVPIPLAVAVDIWGQAYDANELDVDDFRLARLRKLLVDQAFVSIPQTYINILERQRPNSQNTLNLANRFSAIQGDMESLLYIMAGFPDTDEDTVSVLSGQLESLQKERQSIRYMLRCVLMHYIRHKTWLDEDQAIRECSQSGLE